jgi:biopolymer transport protein TolQ
MQDLSLLQLVLGANLIVQIIIVLLLLLSVISWGIIARKWLFLIKIRYDNYRFLKKFHAATNITTLYQSLKEQQRRSGNAALFHDSIQEYDKISQHTSNNTTNSAIIIDNISRVLESSVEQQAARCQRQLATLATFGSVSPYIGLLGTVIGIIHAFVGLSSGSSATLTSVAPGIAEALITTAIGLFVAIPAYLFYNKFATDAQQVSGNMYRFADELLNLISRRLLRYNANSHD